MFRKLTTCLAFGALMATSAVAENFEVRMMNRGEAGSMVFEPAFLQIAAGDTVTFVATSRAHNAETIDGMIPEGATPFSGRINEEISVTLNVDGVYAVKCRPHFAMGMVMTIAVGDVTEAPEGFLECRLPRKAAERLAEQLANF